MSNGNRPVFTNPTAMEVEWRQQANALIQIRFGFELIGRAKRAFCYSDDKSAYRTSVEEE